LKSKKPREKISRHTRKSREGETAGTSDALTVSFQRKKWLVGVGKLNKWMKRGFFSRHSRGEPAEKYGRKEGEGEKRGEKLVSICLKPGSGRQPRGA